MNALEPNVESDQPKETWSVVVVYEDTDTRQRAMAVCDYLAQQFWAEAEFQFHWWRADFLEDRGMSAAAANDAVAADFIVFCGGAGGDLPPLLKAWFESWIERREGREGALVDLTKVSSAAVVGAHSAQMYLRQIARRAMLDYLTNFPPTPGSLLPDSFETATLRADQVTSVLDEILRRPRPPPHYGLNE